MVVLTGLLGVLRYSVRGKRSKNIRASSTSTCVDPGRRYRRVPCHRHVPVLLFWEMMLVPMYFLIALWGHKPLTVKRVSRRQPSSSFTPRRWSGDVDRHPGAGFRSLQCDRVWTFNYEELLNTPMSNGVETC